MLLPSALPCDSSHTAPLTRLQAALFASPPASPPQLSTQSAFGNLFSTCRSLQSLLNNPAPAPPAAQQQQHQPQPQQEPITPPLAPAQPPLKLRLRSRKADTTPATLADHGPARKRVVKRTAAAAIAHQQHQHQQPLTRSANKRRRGAIDTSGRHNHDDSDSDIEKQQQQQQQHTEAQDHDRPHPAAAAPHTPKRSRIAPEVLPLGLERADYHSLHSSLASSFSSDADGPLSSSLPADYRPQDHDRPGTDVVVETDGELWSTEEDRILVELVLEKLKLTKSDWQDCARSLGKDRGSVGRRWKTLMVNGDVGLKRGCLRRPRVYGTWR